MRAIALPGIPAAGVASNASTSTLFDGLNDANMACVTSCLGVQAFAFERGEEILACQESKLYYGVLISGTVFDVRRHADGEHTLVDVIEPGDLFGEGWVASYYAQAERPRERAAIGGSTGSVLLLDPAKLSDPGVECAAKALMQQNLFRSVLGKQERLRTKLEILRHRSLRNRLANFLLVESQRRGATQFSIPLSRSELAHYLHADRAAVSRELARMKQEDLIDVHRNSFVLHRPEEIARSVA